MASFKIEVGGTYLTRGGEIVKVRGHDRASHYQWDEYEQGYAPGNGYSRSWDGDGLEYSPDRESENDLVARANLSEQPEPANKIEELEQRLAALEAILMN